MKRFALLSILLVPVSAVAVSLNIDPLQSGSIAVTTVAATPTQIFINDPYATSTCVVNASTNTVYFVGYSTTSALGIGTNATLSISASTGSFSLQGQLVSGTTLQAQKFCFDGPNSFYTGPIWAAAGGSGGTSITRIRTH